MEGKIKTMVQAQRPAIPQADVQAQRPAIPQADGQAQRPAIPQADGQAQRSAIPQADGQAQRPAIPQADGQTQRPAIPIAALQVNGATFIKQYAPLPAMRRCASVDTPVKAAADQGQPTLVAIRLTYGDAFMLGYIKLWIVDLIEYLGGKELTDAQLEETVLRIYHNNYYLNIADLNILLNRVKDGDISITTPINGAKLNQLFAQYRAERAEAVAESHRNEHEVMKKHGYIPHVNDIAAATLEAMRENQMAEAERQAKAEEAELNRQYRAICTAQKVWEKYPGLRRERKEE